MPKKDGNEITVRVICSKEELFKILYEQNFKQLNEYNTVDIFMIPKNIDIKNNSSREILKQAILLREFKGISTKKEKRKITYKNKEFDSDGNILSQYSINCDIESIADAKELFEHIGYTQLMKTSEKHFSYEKNNLKLIIKIISNDNILIEIEMNEFYTSIDKLKEAMNKSNIPYDKSNYFVKKAEEELEKIKNKM